MATTQNDNRAKFLELRKQGISVADARNQTYWPPPVVPDATPTTPTPPTPAPAPTVNVQEQMAGKNVAERQAIRNGIPTTPTPVTPTPTPTVATTPPVSQAPVQDPTPWITQSSFQQAQAESEKIKAQNEAQMKLNTQQADLKAQERQQVAQETARANTPTNQKDVLNALVSGVSVAPQNTSAYRNAQMQYKNYQKFATMTPSQLVDNMKMWEIGTETAQLLASNPSYIKAKEDFDKFQKNQSINNMIKSVAEGATGKTTAVDHYQNASDAIAKKLGITETNADAFARIVSKDPETLQLTKTVSNIAKQLNTLNTERNAVYEDLKKQYPDLSASAIMTLMAGRTKEATAQIDALNSSLTLTQADLKMAMEMAKSEYDATKEDITLQAWLAKEDRAYQQALDLSQAQFEQWLTQKAQLTNDPTTAIGGVIKQFSDLGIVGDRDLAWHVAEQKRLGMTLPEYTKKMIQDFKAKPEYQQALAKKANEWVSFQTIGDKVYKVQNWQLVDTWISAKKASEPVWQEWEDASGKHAGWVTPGVTPSTSTATAVKPTGNIVPVTAGNKTVRLDQSGAGWFESAINQLTTAWIPIVVWQGARDQATTIKEMADRYGIPFNSSNPAETAWKLRKAGHQVADPWKSNHESGMAIDVYWDSKLWKVSPAQEKILNANGWYSAGIPGDAGHFEYRWGSTSTKATWSLANLAQFMKDNQDRWQGYSNDDVKAFNEKIDRLSNAWDENGMALAYRNMVMKDKDFKKDFDDTQKFSTALDSVQKMVSDYEKAGKDTNALKKIAETVGRKLWVTTDTALAQLQTQMGVTMANYIKSISGTAASDAEVTRLMGNMANIGNVSDLNTAIISTVKENAMNGIKSMIDTRMYWMPEELKPKVFWDIYSKIKTPVDKWSAIGDILSKALSGKPKQ